MRLVQFKQEDGRRRVARVSEDGQSLIPFKGLERLYDAAMKAADTGAALAQVLEEYGHDDPVAYDTVAESGRLLVPLDHPDQAHFLLTGTGLTPPGFGREPQCHAREAERGRE